MIVIGLAPRKANILAKQTVLTNYKEMWNRIQQYSCSKISWKFRSQNAGYVVVVVFAKGVQTQF